MIIIEVKTCADCPFLQTDWFPTEGCDVHEAYCTLWFHLHWSQRMIASKPASVALNLLMPDWCPLRNENYTIGVEKA